MLAINWYPRYRKYSWLTDISLTAYRTPTPVNIVNLELYCRRAVVDTHGSRLLARPWKGGLRWQPFMRRESGMIKGFDTEQPGLQMLTQPID